MDMDESELQALVDKKDDEEEQEQDNFNKGMDAKNKKVEKKLKEQDKVIESLKEKVSVRELAEKYDKVKLTKELLEEIKKL